MQNQFNVSEIKLTYKPDYKISERPIIKKSLEAYQILKQHWDAELIQFLEEFKIILLNTRNRVLGIIDISLGGLTHVIVDIRIVIAAALKANATAIILAHNHPAGSVQPSTEDIHLTNRLVEAGKLLNISVYDHLILTSEDYYSFSDNGMI